MPRTEDNTHTPTPWRASAVGPPGQYTFSIRVADGHRVALAYSPNDAAFIVRAVNNHEALLAALEAQQAREQGDRPPWGHGCQWCGDCLLRLIDMRVDAIAAAVRPS